MLIDVLLKNLQDLIELRKISDAEFARICNIDRGVISHWFTKRSKPSLEKIEQVANAFSIKPHNLLIPNYVFNVYSNEQESMDLYVEKLAMENLNEQQYQQYSTNGGPAGFLKILKHNKETNTYNHTDWFFILHTAYRPIVEYDIKQAAADMIERIKQLEKKNETA